MSMLSHLDLSHNQFTGTLPMELVAMGKLKSLDLSHNKIYGSLATGMKRSTGSDFYWSAKYVLSFNDNQFIGTLPEEIMSLPHLKHLDLHGNLLTGSLPTESTPNVVHHQYPKTIHLEYNSITTGTFPPRLCPQKEEIPKVVYQKGSLTVVELPSKSLPEHDAYLVDHKSNVIVALVRAKTMPMYSSQKLQACFNMVMPRSIAIAAQGKPSEMSEHQDTPQLQEKNPATVPCGELL